jgi:hypothetical protein
MADKHGKSTTPLGLVVIGGFTQRSFVATLGFGAESLWDSYWEYPKGIRAKHDDSLTGIGRQWQRLI